MKPHRIHVLILVAASILFWHEVAVADNWPIGTVLTYTYFSDDEGADPQNLDIGYLWS